MTFVCSERLCGRSVFFDRTISTPMCSESVSQAASRMLRAAACLCVMFLVFAPPSSADRIQPLLFSLLAVAVAVTTTSHWLTRLLYTSLWMNDFQEYSTAPPKRSLTIFVGLLKLSLFTIYLFIAAAFQPDLNKRRLITKASNIV